MAGVGALNLSLLSRGIGEVQTNGHEKVEVFLEPEDYYNFVNSDRYYLPPIKTNFSFTHGGTGLSSRGSREFNEIHLPKTFTTRKGALLLFSEDFALRDKEREAAQKDGTSLSIHTVEDLAKSILSYGSHDRQENTANVYMKFLHQKRDMKRQIRPGFSAKRYLATWTRNWDDSVLETVISKGYITERSLFHYNLVIPHLRRRLIAEDLSHYPAPYRLMRSMLLCPGSLSGYTFYRAVTETEDMLDSQQERVASKKRTGSTTIKVIKTQKDGMQREVSYASLDRTSQEEVITDLLVKSAVHYALIKQKEYMAESLREIGDDHQGESTEIRKISTHTPVPDFNMKEAVETRFRVAKLYNT
ncbi:uncharacterized protein KIAA2012 homolog [Gigantopelta aegis]|uniref:uncharacterized protein KIAA2012 homolog n=1 Tax=Gigantopelta aegis TaxID=1735272 RepID=UPI001B88B3B1|nr:uncharacterized protein KIAA2012 homolog [Gigantopelta aegis]